MKKFLAASVAVAAMLAAPTTAAYVPVQNVTFENWLAQNPRDYANSEANGSSAFELELRRQIFLTNLATIKAHNERYEAGLETWYMAPNQFLDLTEEEFEKNHLGLQKMTQTNGSSAARRLNSLKGKSGLKLDSFEPIDWTKEGIVPEAISQGACGSCWANAAANTLTSRINQKFGTKASNYVSRQQATSCTENKLQCGGTGGCSGATAQLAFEHWANHGVVTEADYPYTSGSGSDGKCIENSHNPTFSIDGFKDITPNDRQALLDALKEGPVSVSAMASGWSFYSGGIYTKCDNVNVNHAITLTGVGKTESGQYYYKIMNSWGKSWGENGEMRIQMAPPDQEERCAQDTEPFDGSACKLSPEPPRTLACGCNGILYDSAVPVGIKKL